MISSILAGGGAACIGYLICMADNNVKTVTIKSFVKAPVIGAIIGVAMLVLRFLL